MWLKGPMPTRKCLCYKTLLLGNAAHTLSPEKKRKKKRRSGSPLLLAPAEKSQPNASSSESLMTTIAYVVPRHGPRYAVISKGGGMEKGERKKKLVRKKRVDKR